MKEWFNRIKESELFKNRTFLITLYIALWVIFLITGLLNPSHERVEGISIPHIADLTAWFSHSSVVNSMSCHQLNLFRCHNSVHLSVIDSCRSSLTDRFFYS